MDTQSTAAQRTADRRLVRQMARRYRRERDLGLVLPGKTRDYELTDRACRWITADIMHRLSATLRRTLAEQKDRPATLELLAVRACLRGEARRYRRQTRERRELLQNAPVDVAAPSAVGRQEHARCPR